MDVIELRAEHRRSDDCLGLGSPRPRLSWRTTTTVPGWTQRSYEIAAIDARSGAPLWASGRVTSSACHLVPWDGPNLESRQRVRWQVTVEGSDGTTAVSEAHEFELGLLAANDWRAEWITPTNVPATNPDRKVSYLRREFTVTEVRSARLHIAALGAYSVEINGSAVGDHVLAPGWTTFDRRIRTETHDVTPLLHHGANEIVVAVADGWYGERYGFDGNGRRIYDDDLAVLAQIDIDGVAVCGTDEHWRCSDGPVVSASIYQGEAYDARIQCDWSAAHAVRIAPRPTGTLVARVGPPVRRIERRPPRSITTSPSGQTIIDFGQNLVGWLCITVDGAAGSTVTVRHAEVLEDGELCTRVLREAAQTDRYTLRGGGAETWEPTFTFHGFRYAEVSGWPGTPAPDAIEAIVVHSDMERTGWFECSDDRINRLHDNIVWGMRGNFLDIPTDCPQRDERLGWTGDANVFSPTACFLHDVDGFFASWLEELAVNQFDDGLVPSVVPDIRNPWTPAAIWGDAAVVVPWVLYERYGDKDVLRAQYPSMRAWVECELRAAGRRRLWNRGFQYGDWVDPAAAPDRPWDARTEPALVAQAAMCHSLDVLVRTARLLGHVDDVERFGIEHAASLDAFHDEYVTPNGRLASDAQTAYALAIHWDLLRDDHQRRTAGNRLAMLVLKEGFRIGTGFAGTPVVCDALCATGHSDVAYALLEQTECPSWLYSVLAGATTIWERWDSLRPDGSVNPGEMTSFNHYALGAVGDWLHRTVAGLAPGAPGYRTLDVRIRPGGTITSARARHLTPNGPATVAWSITGGGTLDVMVEVPPNSDAIVRILDDDPLHVGAGIHEWTREQVSQ